jgi:hypothetical protein
MVRGIELARELVSTNAFAPFRGRIDLPAYMNWGFRMSRAAEFEDRKLMHPVEVASACMRFLRKHPMH